MFNLLNLANVVSLDRAYIQLNDEETRAIEILSENIQIGFDIYKYGTDSVDRTKLLVKEWQKYYSSMDPEIANLQTTFTKAQKTFVREKGVVGLSTLEIGDMGESLVYQMEKERVKRFKERLSNKVLFLGKTKGVGYDISSLEADENPQQPEFARYIEVKSTRRVTKPSFLDNWTDTLSMTAKEWIAAEQYGAYYNIYRVYFTKEEIVVVRINNPFKLYQEGKIEVFPTIYQVDFGKDAIDRQYKPGDYK